jgi:hypothetical protein
MADDPRKDLEKARKTLIELRHNWAKAIAAGYKRGETEAAITAIIEVQHAIDVIDSAIEELEEADEQDEDEDEE